MAIDVKSVSQLITEFRALQSKDAVSPESLGYILQRIADLLATAGTSETIEQLQKLLEGLKTAGLVLTGIEQGQADRNNIYTNKSMVNMSTGAIATSTGIFIQQATTERAGAMRAQQVTDLNTARNNINGKILPQLETHENAIAALQSLLGIGDGSAITNVVNASQISCLVVDGMLKIKGASKLVEAGYVPYLFRWTRKRNHYHDKYRPEDKIGKKYCAKTKGWHLYGSCHSVDLSINNILSFSTNSHFEQANEADGYSPLPDSLVRIHNRKDGRKSIGWGRSTIDLGTPGNPYKQRMVRLRFAVGFAKKIEPNKVPITPANLVSSLAEFSIVYNPISQRFYFSK